jgi:hypothetical protein
MEIIVQLHGHLCTLMANSIVLDYSELACHNTIVMKNEILQPCTNSLDFQLHKEANQLSPKPKTMAMSKPGKNIHENIKHLKFSSLLLPL